MATQPNIEDFASLLNIPSARRAARNIRDSSSAPQIDQFGARPGRPVATTKARRLAAEAVSANAIIHARLLAARDEVVGDPDYATLQQRWDDAARRILDDGLDRISHQGLRDRVQTDLLPTLAKERAAVANQASRTAVQQHAANRDTMLRNLLQRQSLDPNDALLGGGTDAYHAMIDDAVGRGYLSADEALAEKRRGALALCEGEYVAMARRDPDRAIRKLRGEADGHPLLVHLPQERKDALIREAQQRLAANGMDAELADVRRQQQERRASDEAESAIVANLFGDCPSVTANAILDNTALSEEARQRLLTAAERQKRSEPTAQVSQAATLSLLDSVRRRHGDEQRIADLSPIIGAYNAGYLTRADFRHVARQLNEAKTPDGELLSRRRREFINSVAPLITSFSPSAPSLADTPEPHSMRGGSAGAVEEARIGLATATGMRQGNDSGGAGAWESGSRDSPPADDDRAGQSETASIPGLSQLYDLERDLDERIDRRRKEGKNPFDLLDPSKPEFVGTAEALSPYADEALRQTLEDRARHLSCAAAASAEHFEREANPAELAGARDALRQGADHRSVIRRFNSRGINFSRL
jgi:hypothetical protein